MQHVSEVHGATRKDFSNLQINTNQVAEIPSFHIRLFMDTGAQRSEGTRHWRILVIAPENLVSYDIMSGSPNH